MQLGGGGQVLHGRNAGITAGKEGVAESEMTRELVLGWTRADRKWGNTDLK